MIFHLTEILYQRFSGIVRVIIAENLVEAMPSSYKEYQPGNQTLGTPVILVLPTFRTKHAWYHDRYTNCSQGYK